MSRDRDWRFPSRDGLRITSCWVETGEVCLLIRDRGVVSLMLFDLFGDGEPYYGLTQIWRNMHKHTYIYYTIFFIWHLVDALLPHILFLQWVERWLLRQSCLTPRLLIFLQVIMPRPRGRGRGRGRPALTNDVRQPEVVFWNIYCQY